MRPMKFELGLDFLTVHLSPKFHHSMFTRSQVTCSQTHTNKETLLKTSSALCYMYATPVEKCTLKSVNKVHKEKWQIVSPILSRAKFKRHADGRIAIRHVKCVLQCGCAAPGNKFVLIFDKIVAVINCLLSFTANMRWTQRLCRIPERMQGHCRTLHGIQTAELLHREPGTGWVITVLARLVHDTITAPAPFHIFVTFYRAGDYVQSGHIAMSCVILSVCLSVFLESSWT